MEANNHFHASVALPARKEYSTSFEYESGWALKPEGKWKKRAKKYTLPSDIPIKYFIGEYLVNYLTTLSVSRVHSTGPQKRAFLLM
jgi:hypothetical protein